MENVLLTDVHIFYIPNYNYCKYVFILSILNYVPSIFQVICTLMPGQRSGQT